jgi:uncharacterized protein (TIGR02246 family)
MSPRSACSSLGLALLIAACAKPASPPAAAAPAVDSAAVKAAVADVWQRYTAADTAGNVTAVMAMIGDSARADVRGMPPLIGKAAWQNFYETAFKSSKFTAVTVTPDLTIAISNELAYQNGSYAESSTTKGKSTTEYGRYACAIRKDADGQWRFAYVMAFADSTSNKKM